MAGMACPASPHWVNVPFAAAGGQHTFSTTKGNSAVDGVDGTALSCTVKASANLFDVSASLTSPATDPQTGMPVDPTIVTLTTSIAADGTSMGALTVQDAKTLTSYTSVNDAGSADATCTVSVKPLAMGDQLAVAPGHIWASVSCPRFRDVGSSNLNEICSIGAGIMVLENCQQ
jgi:hypothetical protein